MRVFLVGGFALVPIVILSVFLPLSFSFYFAYYTVRIVQTRTKQVDVV